MKIFEKNKGLTIKQERKAEYIDSLYTINLQRTFVDNEGILYVELLYMPNRWYAIMRNGRVENQWGRNVDFRRERRAR